MIGRAAIPEEAPVRGGRGLVGVGTLAYSSSSEGATRNTGAYRTEIPEPFYMRGTGFEPTTFGFSPLTFIMYRVYKLFDDMGHWLIINTLTQRKMLGDILTVLLIEASNLPLNSTRA